MPRKSSSALSTAVVGIPQRISPPEGLSDAERGHWVKIVNTKPIEWFGEDSAPVLVEYVRAIERCNELDRMVKDASTGDLKEYLAVLKARNAESQRLAQFAGKLRLTQQSRYTPQAAATASKKAAQSAKPWEKAA